MKIKKILLKIHTILTRISYNSCICSEEISDETNELLEMIYNYTDTTKVYRPKD